MEYNYDVKGPAFYPSYHEAIMSIPDPAIRLKMFEIVTTYLMTGMILDDEEHQMDWAEKAIFTAVKPNIDKSRKQSKNRSGDGDIDDEITNEEPNENQTKTNDEPDENNKKKNKKKNIEDENKKKHKHGEYAHVLLSDEELEKLNEEYGSSETEAAIKYLDEYIEMKGAKYKSHYLVMRKWVFDAVKENRAKNRGDPKDDLSEWAKEMERKLERGDTS